MIINDNKNNDKGNKDCQEVSDETTIVTIIIITMIIVITKKD